ncbi:glycogen debranching protein GlgX [Enterobacter cloacae]|uniref:glycogen debranching protein GlgX n=1 Tax=Enterobacter cloacae TaxID=550 RepID=UPI003F440AFF
MTQLTAGKPEPLGASFDGKGVNFTLFSAHAERVELCVFDGEGNEHRYDLPARTGDTWHGYLAGGRPGMHYGFRVHGPWAPAQGHWFNPAKLLIDPCAHRVEGEFKDDPIFHVGYGEPDHRDSAHVAPKGVVVGDRYDWEDDAPPGTPWGNTVIYEAHVKGLTYLHPSIPKEMRGTYKALGHPTMIAYLKHLGITALELLPIAHFASEPRLQRLGLSNYWGYNPLAMFALDPRYAVHPDKARDEFRDAVKALHAAGIEVILDVVLNHSAESDLDGPTLSMRGIDNRSYYWIREDGDYHNWTGCGNTLNLSHPAVTHFAYECLKYWVETFHVDGFRFDLAPVMGRTPGFSQQAPLFEAIKNCPVLSRVKLIAEPWDIGEGGYQVGNFPPLFAEWNDHYRDAVRRFWLERSLSLGEFAGRFAASSDLFKRDGKRPSATVNLVTAHDGFTLRDCVCFNQKHNEANGEENRDGTNNNHSFNHGIEGLGGSLDVIERRRASVHALLTTLLLSQGTPMLLAGDEHGHSQHGNNNAYCQDNTLTWLDWGEANSGLIHFTAALIHLRQQIPALTANRWWEEGDGNVRWLNKDAQPLSAQEWQHGVPRLQILLSDRWLVTLNATDDVAEIVLPDGEWRAVPPFAGADNPVVMAVWHGPAHGVCVFQDDKKGVSHG